MLDGIQSLDSYERLTPPSWTNGSILLTALSRLPIPGSMTIDLGPLADEESTELLKEVAYRDIEPGASSLCRELQHLPLAIIQAGAYLSNRHDLSADAYSELLREHSLIGLSDSQELYPNYDRVLHSAWALCVKASDEETSGLAVRLYAPLAFMHNADIPRELIVGSEPPSKKIAALESLLRYRLLEFDGSAYHIHSLSHRLSVEHTYFEGDDLEVALHYSQVALIRIVGFVGFSGGRNEIDKFPPIIPHLTRWVQAAPLCVDGFGKRVGGDCNGASS